MITKDTKVRMFASLSSMQGTDEDFYTLGDLGWEGETGEELDTFLEQCAQDHLNNILDYGADILEEESE